MFKRRLIIWVLRLLKLGHKFKVCGHRVGKECGCFYMIDLLPESVVIKDE